jgi:hypothetical protein
MPTRGQTLSFRSNVNTYICLAFIFSFSLACGLVLWDAAFGDNPIANLLVSSASVAQYNNY